MSNLIIFGSVGFIIVALIAIILILWVLDSALSDSHDNGGGGLATLITLGFVILYYFFGSQQDVRDALNYIITNPSVIVAWFAGYLGLGVIWGFVKWYFFLHKQVDNELSRLKHGLITKQSDVSIPTARDNKWRIMSWMMYWPFSALWTAIDQPIKYAFNYIFAKLEGVFNKISNHMFKDVHAQFEAKKAELRETERKNDEARLAKLNKKENEFLAREKQLKEMESK